MAVLLASVATGCAPAGGVAPLPAHSFGPNIDSNRFDGVLRFDDPCLYLAAPGADLNVVWPAGYSRIGSPPVVVRSDGTRIATVGDTVAIGGLPTEVQIATPGCPSRPGVLLGVISYVNGESVKPAATAPRPPPPDRTKRPFPFR